MPEDTFKCFITDIHGLELINIVTDEIKQIHTACNCSVFVIESVVTTSLLHNVCRVPS